MPFNESTVVSPQTQIIIPVIFTENQTAHTQRCFENRYSGERMFLRFYTLEDIFQLFSSFIIDRLSLNILHECFPESSVGKESTCNAGDPGSIPGLGRFSGEGIGYPLQYSWASLVPQLVKNSPAMWETWV